MWRYCIVCLLALFGCESIWAQNVIFTAQAVNKAGIQDQLQLVYTIQDVNDLQSLNPPENLKRDFQIIQGPFTSRQTNMSVINGKMTQSQSLSLTYIIQPRRMGNITLPPAVAKDASGHTYQSNSLAIQVVKGSLAAQYQQQQRGYDPFDDDPFEAMRQQRMQQMQAMRQQQQAQQAPANVNLDKDLFIRVTVDKNKVHVGEQITATYKLYSRVPMQVSISKLPSLNGFWTQDFEMPKANIKPTEEIIDGKKYQVFILKKSALFPQQTGNLELDPAEADGIARIVQQVRRNNPYANFFDDPALQNAFGSLMMNDPFFNDDFFSSMAYRDVKVHLKSTPVKINVTALPDEGKPEDYTNAVGNFTITSSLDKKELTTDDVANLKVTISGSGNLKLIEAPKLKLPNGLGYLDPVVIDTITGRTTTISGSKIITYPLTPNNAGDYNISPVSFTYFNPQSGKYVTLTTQPEKLHVTQGKGVHHDNKSLALTDIHPINKKPLNDLSFNSKPMFFKAGYWSMYALPLFAFIGIVVWKRRDEEMSKDIVGTKMKRANKIALKRLQTAQKLLQQGNQKLFYDEVSKAIWLYLSDKLNIPLSSLSHEQATAALSSKKVSPQLQDKVKSVINECETALYAGYSGSQQMNQVYNNAVTVISELEEVFNS